MFWAMHVLIFETIIWGIILKLMHYSETTDYYYGDQFCIWLLYRTVFCQVLHTWWQDLIDSDIHGLEVQMEAVGKFLFSVQIVWPCFSKYKLPRWEKARGTPSVKSCKLYSCFLVLGSKYFLVFHQGFKVQLKDALTRHEDCE